MKVFKLLKAGDIKNIDREAHLLNRKPEDALSIAH